MLTVADLKNQRRWVLWRLEPGKDDKPTKVPYQPNGYKASITNPKHLRTYAELEPHAAKFSGIGLALGEFDGVSVWGVDIDKCCDAMSGKFSPESREVVIALNSYAEYSPSGTGCHIWGIGTLPGKGLQKPYPGAKQIEVKGLGYYQTYTGRHLAETPNGLEDRQQQITALYNRVQSVGKPKADALTVTMTANAEEKFAALMAGDMRHYNGDHSAADFALCIFLAQKYNCNAFKIDAEFRKSGLYRDKWERDDYRENTITKAVAAVLRDAGPIVISPPLAEKRHETNGALYPIEVWDGTAVGEFAKLCAHDNNVPRKLYAESFRTVLGAVVGNQLSCTAVEGAIPRSYTVIIAPFGKGKGTAIRKAVRFFSQSFYGARHTGGLTVQGDTPGLLSGHRDFIWKPQGIGAWNASASSVPGMAKLAKDLEETIEKKPQLTWGTTLPRILSVHEEMKTFFSTIYIDGGVGVGMDGVICQLWDDVEFNGTATGTRDALYGQMMFSILGGVTPDDWFDLISRGNAIGGGLMSRLNLIGTEGNYENVPKMTPPNLGPLQESFIPRIKRLADVPEQIAPDEGAERVIAEWADTLPEGSERLNVQVWRSALLLAWLRREEIITARVAEDAVRLGRYQAASQDFYRVAAADNPVAKSQATILRVLEMKGPKSRRELQRLTHAERLGTQKWNLALDGLIKEMKVGQEEGRYFAVE